MGLKPMSDSEVCFILFISYFLFTHFSSHKKDKNRLSSLIKKLKIKHTSSLTPTQSHSSLEDKCWYSLLCPFQTFISAFANIQIFIWTQVSSHWIIISLLWYIYWIKRCLIMTYYVWNLILYSISCKITHWRKQEESWTDNCCSWVTGCIILQFTIIKKF